jgi:hypothetical protein
VLRGWQEEAAHLLQRLAEANRQGLDTPWEFNEWMHGQSGHPMGYPEQAWSASGFLYAEAAVRTRQLPMFADLLAAKPASAVAAEQNDMFTHPGGGPAG